MSDHTYIDDLLLALNEKECLLCEMLDAIDDINIEETFKHKMKIFNIIKGLRRQQYMLMCKKNQMKGCKLKTIGRICRLR